MQHWLSLMASSFPFLLRGALVFTVPLTLLSFTFGLLLGFGIALVRLFGGRLSIAAARF